MDLIVASAQVAHDVAEAISVVEESRVDELELLGARIGVPLDLEQLDKGLLVAWAAVREHPLVVELGSNVRVETACISFAWLLLRSGRLLFDGVLHWVLRTGFWLDLVGNNGPFGIIRW